MDELPRLLKTTVKEETYGGVTFQIDGELVPTLTVDVSNTPVYFEHHILLWKHPTVKIGLRPMRGAMKRMMAGMQIFVTEASGQGMIAFSRDDVGHVFSMGMPAGSEMQVREHQFLAATRNIGYSFERVRGISNMLFGASGFFIDRFRAGSEDGVLWLHGYGNVFEKTLAAGETIDVEPGAWIYKDPSVRMETFVDRLTSGLFGGVSIVINRFTGPGRVGIQSMYAHYPTAE
jgi:uncharacterized protein (AIM24 family)